MLNQNILLVHLYSNGDSLYATAVARQIKQDYPNCKLTWAIASFCKDIIANNPFVDDVLEVTNVAKLDIVAYRKFKKQILKEKQQGKWDAVFFTNLIDDNQANYDGCTRASTFRGYPKNITVPIQPILNLYSIENEKASIFAAFHQLEKFKHVILFEFAPQSGQSQMTLDFAIQIATQLTVNKDVSVILSSANKINHPSLQIIDGSSLSLRETAALTHYCTFLLGASSGITWISTSTTGKQLPMVQLLNANTTWSNPISRDFERFNMPTDGLIELIDFDSNIIENCVSAALVNFAAAKKKYHQQFPFSFKTTRFIVYNLLTYLQFKSIVKHILINRKVHGDKMAFYNEVALGFLMLPFRLVSNTFRKKVLGRR
jgi:ADP-heptose:LPS heptosyltransferase